MNLTKKGNREQGTGNREQETGNRDKIHYSKFLSEIREHRLSKLKNIYLMNQENNQEKSNFVGKEG